MLRALAANFVRIAGLVLGLVVTTYGERPYEQPAIACHGFRYKTMGPTG